MNPENMQVNENEGTIENPIIIEDPGSHENPIIIEESDDETDCFSVKVDPPSIIDVRGPCPPLDGPLLPGPDVSFHEESRDQIHMMKIVWKDVLKEMYEMNRKYRNEYLSGRFLCAMLGLHIRSVAPPSFIKRDKK